MKAVLFLVLMSYGRFCLYCYVFFSSFLRLPLPLMLSWFGVPLLFCRVKFLGSGGSDPQGRDNFLGLVLLIFHALQRKSYLCIPFLGIVRPQSQFPHSCVCERFIYPQDLSAIRIFPCSRIGRPILEMYKCLTDIWV